MSEPNFGQRMLEVQRFLALVHSTHHSHHARLDRLGVHMWPVFTSAAPALWRKKNLFCKLIYFDSIL